MKTLHIDLGSRSYDIHIASGLLDRAGEEIKKVCPKAKRLAIVTDANVDPLYSARVEDSLEAVGFDTGLFTGPAGEGAKCATHLAALWEAMMHFGLTRTDAVVALGGGVVGDLAGFAAATILRGVDFIQIPTTLLAQVDSSVGGKVAIDLAHGKNLAGAFWQPKLVLMDPETLNTLPDGTFADGMAEVIKYGCIADKDFFDFLSAHPSRAEIMANIEHILYTCCDIKRSVVEEDERDTGRRMLLNFGHTIGHAYELAGNYETWTHGQAVSAGMCAALQLGAGLGIMESQEETQALVDLLKAFNLPTHIDCGRETLAKAVGLDKKGEGTDITVILLQNMGKALPVTMSKESLLLSLEALCGR